MKPDEQAVEERVAQINQLMAGHGGSIELVDVSERGSVTVRFLGMCSGCPLKPMTMASTIRPGLSQLPGVTSIEAQGGRISREAEERVASLMKPTFRWE